MKNLIATPRLNEKPAFRNASAKLDAGSDIFGFLYFFQGTQLSQGLYRINDNPEPTYLWTDQYTADWSMAMNGGWIRDGKLCGTNSMVFMGGLLAYGQLELDISTGEILDFRPLTIGSDDLTNQYLTTAYRDLDDRVYGYGYIYDGSAYGFKSADASNLDTSAAVCEVEFEEICTALCYNLQDDAFYGVTTSGDFVSITPEGKQTVIMSLNIPNLSSTITGLTYSPKDQVYIYNAYFKDNNSAIYSIDKDAKPAQSFMTAVQARSLSISFVRPRTPNPTLRHALRLTRHPLRARRLTARLPLPCPHAPWLTSHFQATSTGAYISTASKLKPARRLQVQKQL